MKTAASMGATAAIAVALSFPVAAHAQHGWARLDTAGPPARIVSAAAFDSARGTVVLFGGDRSGNTPTSDTWEWDGARWHALVAPGPSARYGHAMAPDPTGGVILFGGFDKRDSLFADTWRFRDGRWTRLDVPGPSARRSPAVAHDPVRNRVVIFGGFEGAGASERHRFARDTWEWDGKRWTRAAVDGPAPRYGATMAYDERSGSLLLYGGTDHAGNVYGDTWQWDGTRWSKVSDAGPGKRVDAKLVWSPSRSALLLIGGYAGGTAASDMWQWDGLQWNRIVGVTAPRLAFPTFAEHPRRGQILLLGGSKTYVMRR